MNEGSQNPYESPTSGEPNSPPARQAEKWYWLAGDIAFALVPMALLLIGVIIDPGTGQKYPAKSFFGWLNENSVMAAIFVQPWAPIVITMSWVGFRIMQRRLFTTYWQGNRC